MVLPVVLAVLYLLTVSFVTGAAMEPGSGQPPRWGYIPTVLLACIWPVIAAFFFGTAAAESLRGVLRIGHITTTDGEAVWREGVEFHRIVMFKRRALYSAVAPKPEPVDPRPDPTRPL